MSKSKSVHKKIGVKRKNNIRRRNEKIRERFNELYESQGVRIDWVFTKLEDEFFLSQRTLQVIITG